MKPLTPTQRLRPRECTAVGWGPDMCFNQLPKGLSSKTKSRKRSSTLGSSLLRPLRQKWLTHHAKVCAELHKLSCPLQAINGEPAWLIKLTPSTESPESRLWGGGKSQSVHRDSIRQTFTAWLFLLLWLQTKEHLGDPNPKFGGRDPD